VSDVKPCTCGAVEKASGGRIRYRGQDWSPPSHTSGWREHFDRQQRTIADLTADREAWIRTANRLQRELGEFKAEAKALRDELHQKDLVLARIRDGLITGSQRV